MIWNKDKKTTNFMYQPYECTAVEEYLENMAEKGWLLERISGYFFTFKKIEPKKLKYSVDTFSKISVLDVDDSDIAIDYREYCRAAGWKYICQVGKIQVFYSSDAENVVPIQTDDEERFRSIFKSSLYNVFTNLLVAVLFGFNLYLQFFQGTLEYQLTSNLSLFSGVMILSVIAMNLTSVVSFFLWVIRSKVRERNGEFIPYNNYKQLKRKNCLNKIYIGIAIIILMFVAASTNDILSIISVMASIGLTSIFGVVFIKKFINRKKYSKAAKFAISAIGILITIIITINITMFGLMMTDNSDEESADLLQKATFTLSDLGYKDGNPEEVYERFNKSILAERLYYSSGTADKHLSYDMLKSNYLWIIKIQKNRIIKTMKGYGYDIEVVSDKFNLPKDIEVELIDEGRILLLSSPNMIMEIFNEFEDMSQYDFVRTIYEECF